MIASPSGEIRVLTSDVAARIAAGEVIERPASAVKELIENALDAQAQRIEIEVEGGGIDRLVVADDGLGIPAQQLATAFLRYATSKLRSDDDLMHLVTLGFRGEALPSIAAVAHMTCITRTASAPAATRLTVSFGEVGAVSHSARDVGTTMIVEDLFLRTPARRKFLRGRGAETGGITQLVQQLALTRPDVAFSLRVDGRVTFESTGENDPKQVAAQVLGVTDRAQLLAVEATDRSSETRVSGVLGHAMLHRPTRGGITFIVNGRWVQSRQLNFAVEEACRTWTPTGRFPLAVLRLDIPPAEMDVNVHPRKIEVRFQRERALFALVQRAVHDAVLAAQYAEAAHGMHAEQEHGERPLRVLGQAAQTYIIAEGEHGLYLVDQHAAHERVMLERIVDGGRQHAVQYLMEPAVVRIQVGLGESLEEAVLELQQLGYECELFGGDALLVRSIPAALIERQALRVLSDTLDELASRSRATDWRQLIAVRLACHSAVRAGDALDPVEMQALVQQLGEAEICGACAHGRPTAILMSHEDLERQFGRR
ncbi:MAG: DNA mismatch repair endonuclease MutL [Chloroflexota bacterium]